MRTEIFICTCAKDFTWLSYCLRSIVKFTAGFGGVRILVPREDVAGLQNLVASIPGTAGLPVICLGGAEWPGAGMTWHMNEIMHADQHCPAADFIAHFDPDCVFTAPVTPETYFRDGKPVLRYENFHFIGLRHPVMLYWQEATAKCLPFPIHYETMRCHPGVYHRGLYASARQQMEQKTGRPVPDYIRACQNTFPQGFCEFVTLGNVAMHLHRDQYYLVEQLSDLITPDPHVQQFWSHAAVDSVERLWVRGELKEMVPLKMLAELGLA